jgi:hypothetical protein
MHLLYFVEHRHTLRSPIEIAAVGLAHAFDRPPLERGNDRTGPGGIAGVCLSRGDEVGFFPDRQTWLQFPSPPVAPKTRMDDMAGDTPPPTPPPRVWVGYWNDARPAPAELARPETLRGHAVRLRDGQVYQCPMAIGFVDGDTPTQANVLPGTLTIDAAGQWTTGGIEERYKRLWALATEYWDELQGREPDANNELKFQFAGGPLFDSALVALSANYRLTRAEVALLGLFDDQGYVATEILNALVDLPTYRQWLKKKAVTIPAGSPSPAGAAA